ncbi:MAG: hypothetical protein FJW40_09105 [Acidobacteria bacterium]|nr:hypothetical protein [Acidobacteriota bacterium]
MKIALWLLLVPEPGWVERIAASGRVTVIAADEPPRALIAPGQPPLLSFRYFEGKDRHRFGKLDLVMDDAGH